MDKRHVKKNILIIFADMHLTYSPSTLNLFKKLKRQHNVELLSARNATYYTNNEVSDAGIKYIDFKVKRTFFDFVKLIFYKVLDKFITPTEADLSIRSLYNYKTKALIKYIKQSQREIIAIDFLVLWCVQQAGKKAHILSLEIHENDPYFRAINLKTIKSIIIQSKERLDHLFPQTKPLYFIVQNSPDYMDIDPAYATRNKNDLLFCGSAVLTFGIASCLDFIRDYEEYTLTIKGAIPEETERIINEYYGDLLVQQRIILAKDYLSDTELTHFVSKFRIGFAFYDFYRYAHLRTFNYATAPSGKVYQYLNSALPIIANKLPAFEFIAKENCGKLITSISSVQIKKAIDAIETDYEYYAKNAKLLSAKYDFNEMIAPFLKHIAEDACD